MDRLDSMSILVTAVETGSLSAAARRLGTPLATVSRKVSALEAHLKTRLLNRSNRKLTLTDAGRSYVASCKRILEDIGEAERAASGEYSAPRGDLIISAPIVFGRLHVLPIAMAFLKAYPDIDIQLSLADRVIDLPARHRFLRDAAGSQTRLARYGRRKVAFVGYADQRVFQTQSAHNLSRRRQ